MWNDSDDKIMQIYDTACERSSLFPVKCPVCGTETAHIYIHRHDENHGGIWLWCSHCHAYTHMSGIIPDWWSNPVFIDGNELESDPILLDKVASKIDEWVNFQVLTAEPMGKADIN